MKVWVVWSPGDAWGFEGLVRGVYETKELAKASIKGTYHEDDEIKEHEVMTAL